jgi:alpha-ribazole phosphatase
MQGMTKFYLVRHGQTDWNKEGRYQGQADINLNSDGEEQARVVSQKLAGKPIDAIYSSDLKRARHTAEEIGKQLKLPVYLDVRLREINHGIWEGMLYTDIVQKYAHKIKERDTNPLHTRAPQGESVHEVSKRVLSAADDIAQKHPDETIVIVAHGVSLAILACTARGIPLTEVFHNIPDNAHPNLIEWTEDPTRVNG